MSQCTGIDSRIATIREERIMSDRMKKWKANPLEVDPGTRVVAIFDVTGSGKSSTCNIMIGGRERHFEQNSTYLSVTKAVSYRDLMYKKRHAKSSMRLGLQTRIGLLVDTHRSGEEVAEELRRFAAFAPHRLAAILIIMPRVRFTPEQETSLVRIKELLGPTAVKHCVVVFTHCLNPRARQQLIDRDQLLDEVNQLPRQSALRSLVEECNFRVVSDFPQLGHACIGSCIRPGQVKGWPPPPVAMPCHHRCPSKMSWSRRAASLGRTFMSESPTYWPTMGAPLIASPASALARSTNGEGMRRACRSARSASRTAQVVAPTHSLWTAVCRSIWSVMSKWKLETSGVRVCEEVLAEQAECVCVYACGVRSSEVRIKRSRRACSMVRGW